MIWASASNDVATSSFIRLSDKIRILLLVIALPNDSLFIQFVVYFFVETKEIHFLEKNFIKTNED